MTMIKRDKINQNEKITFERSRCVLSLSRWVCPKMSQCVTVRNSFERWAHQPEKWRGECVKLYLCHFFLCSYDAVTCTLFSILKMNCLCDSEEKKISTFFYVLKSHHVCVAFFLSIHYGVTIVTVAIVIFIEMIRNCEWSKE